MSGRPNLSDILSFLSIYAGDRVLKPIVGKDGMKMPNVTHMYLYCGVEGKTNKEIRTRFSELKKQSLEDGAKAVKLELICYGEHTGHWVFSQVFNNAAEYGAAMDKWHVRWASDTESESKHRWKDDPCIKLIAISGTYDEVLD